MKIEAFLICWNEIEILPFVIKHYQKFCDKIKIYDNFSDDGSDTYAKSMGCEVIKFGLPGQLNDDFYKEVKNNCWKGSDADWVIVCDTDELLYLIDGDIRKLLLFPSMMPHKPSIFKTQGWQITSNAMPLADILEITNGYKFDNYSKSIIFDPKRIQEINFNYGAHRISPVGDIVYSEETLYVLHYRQMGGVNRLIKRYRAYQKRMSPFNRKHGHGIHYLKAEEIIRRNWNRDILKSKPLV
jgi:hypothetical protein